MSSPVQARRRLGALSIVGASVLAALTLSAGPAAAAADGNNVPAPDYVVAFGAPLATATVPRDLQAVRGDTVSFENHSAAAAVTPVRVVIGKQTLLVGVDPVTWTADHTVDYQGSYTMLAGPTFHITVTFAGPVVQPAPGGSTPAPSTGSVPARGSTGTTTTTTTTTTAHTSGAAAAAQPVVPQGRPGDPGYVPAGAGLETVTGHRLVDIDGTSGAEIALGQAAAPRAANHRAVLSGSDTAPLTVRLALAALAVLMLAGVGAALARILFRAWLNAAPRTA